MRFLSVLAVLVVMLPAVSLAQGYGGLFADDQPTTKKAEPPGYQGVVPGSVPAPVATPPKPLTKKDTAAAKPKAKIEPPVAAATPPPAGGMTAVPGSLAYGNMPKVTSSSGLALLATIYAQDKNLDNIPDDMAAQFKLPANMADLLKAPRARINGLLPVENSVKSSIDQAFAEMSNKNLSPVDRQKKAAQTLATLKSLRQGLAVQGTIPDKTYKIMGLPDMYIKEEREATKNSLARIDAALAQLK